MSGGADSVALLHLLVEWVRENQNTKSPDIFVLTVDHGLRKESIDDVRYVMEMAEQMGVEAATLKWQGEKPSTRIQEKARKARYDLITDWCCANEVDIALTAHHADDQAETFIMRLLRGSGVDGLSAMSESIMRGGIEICRPLLHTPKADLQSYLEQEGIKWRDDPSNRNQDFERVRIRRLLEQLQSVGFSSLSVSMSASRLQRAAEALENIAQTAGQSVLSIAPEGYAQINADLFGKQSDEIAIRVLSRVLHIIGGKKEPPLMGKLEDVFSKLQDRRAGVQSIAGSVLLHGRNKILVAREYRKSESEHLAFSPGEQVIWDNRFKLSLSADAPCVLSVRFLAENGYLQLPDDVRKKLLENSPLKNTYIRASLPSLWDGEELFAVPHLNFFRSGFRSEFVTTDFIHQNAFAMKVEAP